MQKSIAFLFIFILFLSACGASQTVAPTTAATQSISTSVAATMAVLSPTTASPTAVPTPGLGKVILVTQGTSAGSESDPLAQPVTAALKDLVVPLKWGVETRQSPLKEEIQSAWKVLIFTEPPANLAELQAAAPQTQFIVLGDGNLEARGNLSVIRLREEFRVFMAGYITTLVASDWRSLGLLPAAPANLQDAFLSGGRYWCGRCIPVHGPVVLFPLVSVQAAGAAAGEWQQAVAGQQKNVLEAVYLSPAAHSPALVKALFSQKLVLTGAAYPGDEYSRLWAATLSFDPIPALQKLWPNVSAGKGGQLADAGLVWSNVNDDLFGAGKQRLAKDALAGLLDGTISPFSVPAP
jgi:hypothetical protein